MVKFTTEQQVKIIKFYFKNGRSIVATQRPYMRYSMFDIVLACNNDLSDAFSRAGLYRSRCGRGRSDKVYVNSFSTTSDVKNCHRKWLRKSSTLRSREWRLLKTLSFVIKSEQISTL